MIEELEKYNLQTAFFHNRPPTKGVYPEFYRFHEFIQSEIDTAIKESKKEITENEKPAYDFTGDTRVSMEDIIFPVKNVKFVLDRDTGVSDDMVITGHNPPQKNRTAFQRLMVWLNKITSKYID